jgi:DNA-binding winged helix-turn-helix (wHTH) protein
MHTKKPDLQRFKVLQHFLNQEDEVFTQKELEDWAKESSFDLLRFR